ncbi:hypothetical protein SLEP1_g28634 [Rubroshorea leprosula]|uniref:Uncharacterized protein n=1 Tax=Rubroshorea leprosula TaxID=152421 RepID=A0AAV5K522_9ROSI|nr:hypothetical protein SLEP1_g28634 [Rubroshorea leprosula]
MVHPRVSSLESPSVASLSTPIKTGNKYINLTSLHLLIS